MSDLDKKTRNFQRLRHALISLECILVVGIAAAPDHRVRILLTLAWVALTAYVLFVYVPRVKRLNAESGPPADLIVIARVVDRYGDVIRIAIDSLDDEEILFEVPQGPESWEYLDAHRGRRAVVIFHSYEAGQGWVQVVLVNDGNPPEDRLANVVSFMAGSGIKGVRVPA